MWEIQQHSCITLQEPFLQEIFLQEHSYHSAHEQAAPLLDSVGPACGTASTALAISLQRYCNVLTQQQQRATCTPHHLFATS